MHLRLLQNGIHFLRLLLRYRYTFIKPWITFMVTRCLNLHVCVYHSVALNCMNQQKIAIKIYDPTNYLSFDEVDLGIAEVEG